MNASRSSIDPTPNHVVPGVVEVEGAAHPGGVADRLREVLRERRVLAAVDHHPGQRPDEAVTFTVACDPTLRVLHVDEHGHLEAGKYYAEVEEELSAALGLAVSLWVDSDLINDAEGDDDVDIAYTASEDESAGEGDGWPEFNPAAFEDETPSRVLVFSHRGMSNGLLFCWTIKTDRVEAGVEGDWSVFRFLDKHSTAEVPDASKKELPSVRVVFTEGETDGWAYLNIATPHAKDMHAHVIYPRSAAHARPVLDFESLRPEAQQLLAVLVNDHLAHDSQANLLLADASLDVDAAALHAAIAPGFTGAILDRVEAILFALRIPAALAVAAVRGADLPNGRTYARRPLIKNLWKLSKDGIAGMSPLGGKRGAFRRFDDSLRTRPVLAYAFSTLELAAGVGVIVLGTRAGFGFIVLGAVLAVDAMLDLILTTTRLRERRNG